jgi:hypothetical protein
MIYDPKDPEYPKEWIRDEEGHGKCTAFELDKGQPPPVGDCENQKMLF